MTHVEPTVCGVPGQFWYQQVLIDDSVVLNQSLEIRAPKDTYVQVSCPKLKSETPTRAISAYTFGSIRIWSQASGTTRTNRQYVAMKFRYISISFGAGRYRPHSAEDVLTNQYGDCKDKHTLLVAPLEAAGIPAWPLMRFNRQDTPSYFPTTDRKKSFGAAFSPAPTSPRRAVKLTLLLPSAVRKDSGSN